MNRKYHQIPIDFLNNVLDYNAKTGKLFWKFRQTGDTPFGTKTPDRFVKIWNKRFAGKEAFTHSKAGYWLGYVYGVGFKAHRVAFALYHNRWPSCGIDHINGDTRDNRIENLREADYSVNGKNTRLRTDNVSGHHGVSFDARRNLWHAKARNNKKTVWLGYFQTKEEAIRARKSAELTFGYHANHGTMRLKGGDQ